MYYAMQHKESIPEHLVTVCNGILIQPYLIFKSLPLIPISILLPLRSIKTGVEVPGLHLRIIAATIEFVRVIPARSIVADCVAPASIEGMVTRLPIGV
jgi:hypothetical protein